MSNVRQVALVAVHLASHAPGGFRYALSRRVTVTAVEPGDANRPARVLTDTGELEADLVVAADGIRSLIRETLFPEHPGSRYSGFTAWRFIAAGPPGGVEPAETWGRGMVFGAFPLADGRVADGSYRASRLTGATSGPAVAIRNTGIWLAGHLAPGLVIRQLAPIASWMPPA